MDLQGVKAGIVVNVYHIDAQKKVALHRHPKSDEIFYCIRGEGFGVLEDGKVELSVGKVFIVPHGVMHSLSTDGDLYVASFLVPMPETSPDGTT